MQKMEEQVKTQLKHSEQQEKVANLMAQLRGKEEELTKRESKWAFIRATYTCTQ